MPEIQALTVDDAERTETSKPAVLWQKAKLVFRTDRCDLSPVTISNYFSHLDRFFSENPQDVTQIKRAHMLNYLQRYEYWSTYNHHLAALKSFFAWASDYYDFPDPAYKLKSRKEESLPVQRFLAEWEYQKIKGTEGLSRDIAVFLGNTGLRAAEFLAMRPDHILGRVLIVLGKGRKVRKILLNNSAYEILEKYQFAINFRKNKFMNKYNLRHCMRRMSRQLGLEPFGPHSLRHYFATALISNGANIADVSKILGHSSMDITIKLYYHPETLGCVSLLDN